MAKKKSWRAKVGTLPVWLQAILVIGVIAITAIVFSFFCWLGSLVVSACCPTRAAFVPTPTPFPTITPVPTITLVPTITPVPTLTATSSVCCPTQGSPAAASRVPRAPTVCPAEPGPVPPPIKPDPRAAKHGTIANHIEHVPSQTFEVKLGEADECCWITGQFWRGKPFIRVVLAVRPGTKVRLGSVWGGTAWFICGPWEVVNADLAKQINELGEAEGKPPYRVILPDQWLELEALGFKVSVNNR